MADVTILMTVYNGMPYLPLAVESVLGQTLREFRFVIVNDGSTDGTSDYLKSVADPRVIVLHQENQGTAAAANHGLEHCDTEFVARMDSDDVALATRLEKQLAFLQAHPEVGLVGTQVAPLGATGAGGSLRLPRTHDEIYPAMLAGRHGLAHSSIMFRSQLVKQLGGYWSEPLVDDWDMMLRMGEVAQLANLDEVLHHYRIHAGSLNGSAMRRMRLSIDFACELARRRRAGEPPMTLDEFQAARHARPWWRRAYESLDAHARCQYRQALAELHGRHPLRGSARLAWAAVCSPQLTIERLARFVRPRLSGSSKVAANVREGERSCPQVVRGGERMINRGRHNVLGVRVHAVDRAAAVDAVLTAARQGRPLAVSALAVHGLMTGVLDRTHRHRLNELDLLVPDGQPVRWALNGLHHAQLPERVYGPELMRDVCRAAAEERLPVFLYGNHESVLADLSASLHEQCPKLEIAGAQASRFRPLTTGERDTLVDDVCKSGARILFVGLGCPRQEVFVYEMRRRLSMPMLAVGAAFNFYAGRLAQAPPRLQRLGLEWAFRLAMEPRRLWKRYLVLNPMYVSLLMLQAAGVYTIDPDNTEPPALEACYG